MGAVPTPVTDARPLPNLATVLAATRLTAGLAVGGSTLRGRVRSVHRAAVYIDRPAPHGLLVVAIDDVGGVPDGILVLGPSDLRGMGIRPGMAVLPSIDGLAIPAVAVEIDLSKAVSWSPTLPAGARLGPAVDPGRIADARRRIAEARCLAAELARAGGLAPSAGLAPMLAGHAAPGDPWLARAAALIDAQLNAVRSGEVAAAIDPTIDLIGLGIGLTPSGDDYLVGFLAGLEATDHPARPALAAAIAMHAPSRTTAVGAAALDHATRGAYSERLHDVLVALAGREQVDRVDDLARPVTRAMAYGATSGGDTLVGLFGALDLALAGSAGRGVAA